MEKVVAWRMVEENMVGAELAGVIREMAGAIVVLSVLVSRVTRRAEVFTSSWHEEASTARGMNGTWKRTKTETGNQADCSQS